jgi:hypothetical protein
MNLKLLTLLTSGALALTISAGMAQQDGAPAGERDRSGATTDSELNSAYRIRPVDSPLGYGGFVAPSARPRLVNPY